MKLQRPFLPSLFVSLFLAASAVSASAQLIISEFRVRGPNGANDEFIEIYNNSGADHTVAGGGTGYALAASNGVARFVIPNGTVIPAGGHYLGVNSVGYSLASYPAGNGTTATGDATYTTDIPDNAGIALFNTSVAVDFTLANRLDAVGSTSEADTLYKEGTGYPALTPFSIDYSFSRKQTTSDAVADQIVVPTGGPADTSNNATDFTFVDTNGTSAGAGQRLGTPGPENLSSPIISTGTSNGLTFVDSAVGGSLPPNRVRDFTSVPAQNSTFGIVEFRRTFTNNTGANLTRLRFRIVKITTFPAPSGTADLRPRTSTDVVVTTSGGNKTVTGTTLEEPPSQPNGGGFNSTFSVPTITLGTPLANGASVDLRFLFGIQQTGKICIALEAEGLPSSGSTFWYFSGGHTDAGTADDVEGFPVQADLSITKTDGVTDVIPGGTVTYTIVASNPGPSAVTGATVADTFPAALTNVSWTAVGALGGTTTASPGTGNINDNSVDLPIGGSVTYTVTATLNPSATGTLSNTATIAVPAGVTDPTPGNDSATDSDTILALADLSITKTDGVTTVTAGDPVTYTITVSNAAGPNPVTGATVTDLLPASLTGVTWTAVVAGGATGTLAGSGNINDTVNLPVGASITYTVTATLSLLATGTLANTATVAVPAGVSDPTPGNDSATDTDNIQPRANADVNGDGHADLVFQNNAGQTYVWYLDGAGAITSHDYLSTNSLGDWKFKGRADLNSDGHADLVFQNTAGLIYIWHFDGAGAITSHGYLSTNSLADWKIAAIADMNSDGKADIIFQNNAGHTYAWYLDGAEVITSHGYLSTNDLADWRLLAAGDLNGDGHADLVFQNNTGHIYAWYMDGAGVITSHGYLWTFDNLDDWRIVGIADLNDDGHADIIFQNNAGEIGVWYMDGAGAITSYGYLIPGLFGEWRVH